MLNKYDLSKQSVVKQGQIKKAKIVGKILQSFVLLDIFDKRCLVLSRHTCPLVYCIWFINYYASQHCYWNYFAIYSNFFTGVNLLLTTFLSTFEYQWHQWVPMSIRFQLQTQRRYSLLLAYTVGIQRVKLV